MAKNIEMVNRVGKVGTQIEITLVPPPLTGGG
jgi:hypothetical protein